MQLRNLYTLSIVQWHKYERILRYALLALLWIPQSVGASTQWERNRIWENSLKNPVPYRIEYDAKNDVYIYFDKNSERTDKPLKEISGAEYRKLKYGELSKDYFRKRRDADLGGIGRSGRQDKSPLIPDIQIKNELFGKIFGGNRISIVPQGSVEVSFGYNWNKSDNPTIPEQYRATGIFDFESKMQVNMSGKIGERVNLEASYNTESMFDFQNTMNLNYQGEEDDIIQKIEVGNVSLPLSNSLMNGSQSLFGAKTDLQFGRLKLTGLVSEQKGESSTVQIQGGARKTTFSISAGNYDANRHFFLSHFHASRYDQALSKLPLIQSGFNITRIEVWITNKSGNFNDARNIIALADSKQAVQAPNNGTDAGYQSLLQQPAVRNFEETNNILLQLGWVSGKDYEKIESARKLSPSEYTLNAQLGYVSLRTALNADEVLAVAYEYTFGGRIYKVGEFSDDGYAAPKALVVRMIKNTNLSPKSSCWELMMKNIYAIGNVQLSNDNFELDIQYKDETTGTKTPYIGEGKIKNVPLIRVLGLDQLSGSEAQFPDGQFDYVKGITVIESEGKIIFPVLQPFGKWLKQKLDDPVLAQKYVYQELYDSTFVKARQLAEKNKFTIEGKYKGSSLGEIYLGATDIPQGAVVVTAGGTRLNENTDYTVNYMMGTLQIINPIYLESNTPITVKLESKNNYNLVSKTMLGLDMKYQVNENLNLGASMLRLSERPLTQKVSYGDEPIANFQWGFTGSYQKDSPLLSRWVDALPLIQTSAPSRIQADFEFAQLLPGHAGAIGKSGTTYIDDFEGGKMTIDLRQHSMWFLASTPQVAHGPFFTGNSASGTENRFQASRLSWYSIDPLFLRNSNNTPAHIKNDPKKYRKNHYVREIAEKEIFPFKDEIIGSDGNTTILNLTYYPKERAPYNFSTSVNASGEMLNPRKQWGGMQRAMPITDFESSNIEYLEFWIMDPFIYHPNSSNTGRLYFNLGDISEDVLRDGRKSFENGIPYPMDMTKLERTAYGYVPRIQSTVFTFDNNASARTVQDVGLNGMNDEQERDFHRDFLSQLSGSAPLNQSVQTDPAQDNYRYSRSEIWDQLEADIITRYKYYNNPQGNSPIAETGINYSSTTMPNTEDLNKDNTLNETESFFEYAVDISPNALRTENVGKNYLTDIREYTLNDEDYGSYKTVRWFQFRIPLRQGQSVNGIDDFRSIRFMRAFLTGFSDTVTLRFARMELVRGEWRAYDRSLLEGQEGTSIPSISDASMAMSVVSIEENAGRTPVNYVLPPGASRVIDNTTNQQRQRNEQAIELKVSHLSSGDARAIYKTAAYDMRMFKRLKMDVHAEATVESNLQDHDLSLFIRVGSDFQNNYYEYEIPLSLTEPGKYNDAQRKKVWPDANRLDLVLSKWTDLKIERNQYIRKMGSLQGKPYVKSDGKNTLRVIGNPDLANVEVILIGVRNPKTTGSAKSAKSGIVWINELRLSDFNSEGGWAANARVSTNFADLGSIAVSGSTVQSGFGSVSQSINERSFEDAYNYDLSTQLQIGKVFPQKLGVSLPFFFGLSESIILPKYNPLDQDILLEESLRELSAHEQDSIRDLSSDYTKRKNISLNNVQINPFPTKNLGLINPANITGGYAFSENLEHSPKVEYRIQRNEKAFASYNFQSSAKPLMPFKQKSFFNKSYLSLLREMSVNWYPSQINFSIDYDKTTNEYKPRSYYGSESMFESNYQEQNIHRTYGFSWALTSQIRLEFKASNQIMSEWAQSTALDSVQLDPDWKNRHYEHQYSIQYTVPLNRYKSLEWINANANLNGNYSWDRGPTMTQSPERQIGNQIQNGISVNLNLQFNFLNLYNKNPFLMTILQEGNETITEKKNKFVQYKDPKFKVIARNPVTVQHNLGTKQVMVILKNEKGVSYPVKIEHATEYKVTLMCPSTVTGTLEISGQVIADQSKQALLRKMAIKSMLMVRNFGINYTHNGLSMLSGYMHENSDVFGKNPAFDKPGWDFVLGAQSRRLGGNFGFSNTEPYMLERARANQWLTQDTSVIDPFTMTQSNSLQWKLSLEPFQDLKIDIIANRSIAKNRSYYNVYTQQTPLLSESGSFSMSTWAFAASGSLFENPSVENGYLSSAFERFKTYRREISVAQFKAREGRLPQANELDANGCALGYSQISQEVLVPAFYAAYTGKSVHAQSLNYTSFTRMFPMPNWNIFYTGLQKYAFFKKFLVSASFSHSYKASYTVGSYTTNQDFMRGEDGLSTVQNILGDYYSPFNLTSVSVNEEFSLINMNLNFTNKLQTRIEIKRNRRAELSLSSNNIIDTYGSDIVFGAGYTLDQIPLFIKLPGAKPMDKTNLRIRTDVSIRNEKNIIRRLASDASDEALDQITDGRKNISIKSSVDYDLQKNLSLRLFLDRVVNEPFVSTVKTTNFNIGFSLKYLLGQ